MKTTEKLSHMWVKSSHCYTLTVDCTKQFSLPVHLLSAAPAYMNGAYWGQVCPMLLIKVIIGLQPWRHQTKHQ